MLEEDDEGGRGERKGGNEIRAAAAAKSLQSCPTLCDPMDCSLPGFRASAYFLAKERKHNLWSKSDKNNCLRAIILFSCFDLSFV